MIITCSECSTNYRLENNALLPNGKKVKCTKCAHTWFQNLKPEPEYQVQLSPIPTNSSLPVRIEYYVPIWLKFLPILFFCMIVISTIFLFQKEVVHTFPESNKLYDSIGIPNSDGIRLSDVSLRQRKEYIDINGIIINESSVKRVVPQIIISTLDNNGMIISSRTVNLSTANLAPSGKKAFHKRITDITQNAHFITVAIAGKFDVFSL